MGLLLDPRDPVEHRIEDVAFKIKVLTQRDRVAFLRDMAPIQAMIESKEAVDGRVDIDLHDMPDIMEGLFRLLLLGLLGYQVDGEDIFTPISEAALDVVPFPHWSDLFNRIAEVNLATEEDAKN